MVCVSLVVKPPPGWSRRRVTLEFPCDPATVVGVAQAFWRRA